MKDAYRVKVETLAEPSELLRFHTFLPTLEEVADDAAGVVIEPARRMHQYFERAVDHTPSAVALVCGDQRLSYAELDARANRLANYLLDRGAGKGTTVGILLERSVETYVALLATLKAGAAFVPIDPSYPADRVAFIASDAGLSLLLTNAKLGAAHPELGSKLLILDGMWETLSRFSTTRPAISDEGDQTAYIIYTSGTTGKPKGVAISQSSICYFLSVCTPIYGVTASDRVYQGMTIAFDFSIEEIWPTWLVGATLVAGPNDSRRIGSGLADFLTDQRVSVMCCVPTLLATMDRDIPTLDTLIVGGEACPKDMVERWSRPGRRMLNTYGPTETTVTASWTELEPGKAVTIGRPMPGYRMYVLDDRLRSLPAGESGEICIGGKGVALGYVNRPELTEAKFVADPFERGRRMYRSGDLGRYAPNGEIEFLGRIDTQVKIRGFRIELGEIEAVLLEDAEVENAIVSTTPVGGPAEDIVAYIKPRNRRKSQEALKERLAETLRHRLPVYMVPAYLEVLDSIPMLPSGKADRKQLPEPKSPRLSVHTGKYVAPVTEIEEHLVELWREVFGLAEVSVEADFFMELGGHSLFAARVISRLRQEPRFRRLSIADLYSHPTVRGLALLLEQTAAAKPGVEAGSAGRHIRRHSSGRVWMAGAGQLVLLYALLIVLLAPVAGLIAYHARMGLAISGWDALLPLALIGLTFVAPPVLKWTLIGRFEAGTYPMWGWYYCRWWIVRKALDFSPLHVLAGSPLMAAYARLLGARVGRGCQLATAQLHLPDLIEIGDRVSLGYEVEIQPFLIEDGYLHMAPVRIGTGAYVGTKSVVLLGSEIGPRARVAEQSLVTRFEKIPAGEQWAGSPAQRVAHDDALLDRMEAKEKAPEEPSRGLWLGFAAGVAMLDLLPVLMALPGLLVIAWADRNFGVWASLAVAPLAGLLFVLSACVLVALGKKLAMPRAKPGIYASLSATGLRKWFADRLMTLSLTVTNSLYATLYASPWLRLLGAKVGAWSEVSTVSHLDPDLLTLGDGTFVADLASVGSATFHNGYLALGKTSIGDRTFIGNAAVIRSRVSLPGGALIGVASVMPVEKMRAGSSWLGSPAIFLPKRQVCGNFEESVTYQPRPVLVAYRLFVEFFRVILPPGLLFLMGTMMATGAARVAGELSAVELAAILPLFFLGSATAITLLVAAMKWLLIGVYRPRIEPLWAPFVRHTELITGLYETAVVPTLGQLLAGTPFAAPFLRLFGAHIGKRVYLESTFLTEFDLVHVGNDCSIGRATSLQSHLFEDRVMKMSQVTIGNDCVVGPRAIVLYDSTLEDGVRLDALSLAMKGETLPANTRWRGVPAQMVS